MSTLRNVILLGVSFMLLFTSFQTGGLIQGTVVKSINHFHPEYNADGYTSMSIIYTVLSLANWVAAPFVNYCGPRFSMIISAVTYIIFIANFIYPLVWALYLVSAIIGLGAAVLWTAQGKYLTLCSNDKTMSRNSGLFWALLQCSFLWGNIFVYFYFTEDTITDNIRVTTYIVLSVVGSLGIACLFLLGKVSSDSEEEIPLSEGIVAFVLKSIRNSWRLLCTKRMFYLCLTSIYTGLELGFFSVVFTTMIGNTSAFDDEGNSKRFIGLAGILIGVGEIAGGLSFGILSSKTNRFGRDPIVIIGYVTHMLAFFLILLNFPKNAPIDAKVSEYSAGFISPSIALALVCALLLGFADSCFNTQLYSIIGVLYSDNSAPAFALFKFFQSIACACLTFYSSYVNLYVQLTILALFGSLGTVTFVLVEFQTRKDAANPSRIHQN